MKKFFVLLILLMFPFPASGEDLYTWVGKDGVVNFTDDYANVPLAYRGTAEVQKHLPGGGPSMAGGEMKGEAEEDARVDIFGQSAKGQVTWTQEKVKEETQVGLPGQGESYWKGRVRPWEERLEKATANYCGAQDEFMRIAGELSEMRFGSPTQYKKKIAELDDARFEMQKYQAQMTEAKEALEKISKEAKEAKAHPDWLK